MTRQQWMGIGVAQRESPGWKVTMMLLKPRPALLNADEFRRMQNGPKNGLPVIISRPESRRI
jgi:hypothetical protein